MAFRNNLKSGGNGATKLKISVYLFLYFFEVSHSKYVIQLMFGRRISFAEQYAAKSDDLRSLDEAVIVLIGGMISLLI